MSFFTSDVIKVTSHATRPILAVSVFRFVYTQKELGSFANGKENNDTNIYRLRMLQYNTKHLTLPLGNKLKEALGFLLSSSPFQQS